MTTPDAHLDQMQKHGRRLDDDPQSTAHRVLIAVAHVTGPLEARLEALEKRVEELAHRHETPVIPVTRVTPPASR